MKIPFSRIAAVGLAASLAVAGGPWPVARIDASLTVHGSRFTGHDPFGSQALAAAILAMRPPLRRTVKGPETPHVNAAFRFFTNRVRWSNQALFDRYHNPPRGIHDPREAAEWI